MSIEKESTVVGFSLGWDRNGHDYRYGTHLTVSKGDNAWEYSAQRVTCDGEEVYDRSSSARPSSRIGCFPISEALCGDDDVQAPGI